MDKNQQNSRLPELRTLMGAKGPENDDVFESSLGLSVVISYTYISKRNSQMIWKTKSFIIENRAVHIILAWTSTVKKTFLHLAKTLKEPE